MDIDDLENGEHPVRLVHKESCSELFEGDEAVWSVIAALNDGRLIALSCPEKFLEARDQFVVLKINDAIVFTTDIEYEKNRIEPR